MSAVVRASRCDSCHNGSFTSRGHRGRAGHRLVPRSCADEWRDCSTCHAGAASAFASWAGGAFTHAATDTNCSNCHNGTTATGMKTPPHIPVTGVQCSNCHTNTAANFTTYTMSHSAVSAAAATPATTARLPARARKGAQGTAAFSGHVATNGQDCATCHAGAAASFAAGPAESSPSRVTIPTARPATTAPRRLACTRRRTSR